MKKSVFSFMMACCMAFGMTMTSCNGDDPIITDNVTRTDLLTPMCLCKAPTSGVDAISIANDFEFWTFTDTKAANGSFSTKSGKVYIKCNKMSDSWNVADGRLSVESENFNLVMASFAGARAFAFNNTVYVPSNIAINGHTLESSLVELGLSKARLWRILEKSKETGSAVYIQEVE